MSYQVDATSLLFVDLTHEEVQFLKNQITGLVLRGDTEGVWLSTPFVRWCEAAGYDNRHVLLVMATAYPQRGLLSIVHYYESQKLVKG